MIVKPLCYQIVYPDDHENETKEETPKASAAPQKTTDGAVASFEGYQDYDETKEANEMLNVDAFDSMAGGIIPGQQLSSLCSDD